MLHEGYAREDSAGDRVGSSVTLILDADRVIVVDPGMVSGRDVLLSALAAHGPGPCPASAPSRASRPDTMPGSTTITRPASMIRVTVLPTRSPPVSSRAYPSCSTETWAVPAVAKSASVTTAD